MQQEDCQRDLLAISISSALETQRASNRKQQQKKPGRVFIPFVGSSGQQKDGQRLPGTYPLRKGVSIRVSRVLEIAPKTPHRVSIPVSRLITVIIKK